MDALVVMGVLPLVLLVLMILVTDRYFLSAANATSMVNRPKVRMRGSRRLHRMAQAGLAQTPGLAV